MNHYKDAHGNVFGFEAGDSIPDGLVEITIEKARELGGQAPDPTPIDLLRNQRNFLLAETDWWAVSDRTMTTAETTYRQALRDITNTYSSLDTVIWPTKPE